MSFVFKLFAFLAIFISGLNFSVPESHSLSNHESHTSIKSAQATHHHEASEDDCCDHETVKHTHSDETPTKHCPTNVCCHSCQRILVNAPSVGIDNLNITFSISNFYSESKQPISVELDSPYRPPIV